MKYILLLLLCCIMSGCTTKYVYVYSDDNYDCSYTNMRYIKEYVDNKKYYRNFDHFMQVNYSKLNYNRNISNF